MMSNDLRMTRRTVLTTLATVPAVAHLDRRIVLMGLE